MGAVDGGTQEDFIQSNILIAMSYFPRGSLKSIDDICKARGIPSQWRADYQAQADMLVAQGFKFIDKNQKYIFSKDAKGRYYWRAA